MAANPTIARIVGFGGVGAFGGGIAAGASDLWGYAVTGLVVAGVLTWLGGVWVFPWGSDAYMRRLQRLSLSWRVEAGSARGVEIRRRFERRKRLEKLVPPPAWTVEHARLLELVESEEAKGQERLTPSIRVEIIRCRLAGAELVEQLSQTASDERQRAYTAQLQALLDEAEQDRVQTWRTWQDSARKTAAKLGRAKPPAVVAAEHERLTDAMHRLVEHQERLKIATLRRDPDAVIDAAESVAEADAEVRSINDSLRSKLA